MRSAVPHRVVPVKSMSLLFSLGDTEDQAVLELAVSTVSALTNIVEDVDSGVVDAWQGVHSAVWRRVQDEIFRE